MKPTAEYIRSILHYDPLSGVFTRLVRTSNCIKVGDVAGSVDGNGYLLIGIDGKKYKAHRLAWLYMTGHWPTHEIDHINGIRTDNRWINLREATRQQNMMNKKKPTNNTSGHTGVSWNKRGQKWSAGIRFNGKNYHLGTFDDPELAALSHAGAARILFGDFSHATINLTINNYFNKDPK